MKPLLDFVERGGPVMYALMVLSVLLYARCFVLFMSIRQVRRSLVIPPAAGRELLVALHRSVEGLRHSYQQQRMAIGTMIAAAPLLGLLGTVSGMSTTFAHLSSTGGHKSMEGLAEGISEVLVATETGLSVAIPAMLAVYLSHRQLHKVLQRLNQLELRREAPGA